MTLAIFHPAFETIGGAEILVATQAQYLERHGVDVCVATTAFDAARWRGWFERIPVRVTAKPPWTERFAGDLVRIKRTVPRADACLSDCHTVMACNYPTNVLLGASSISARRVWCCTEPSREFHLVGTNPRVHKQVTTAPGGITEAEQDFARRMVSHQRWLRKQSHADLIAFDIEQTRKLDSIYAISEFSRDSVRRVYGRTDAEVIYPVVRFPAEKSRPRSGLNRTGLNILTHSRLEIPKNVDSVVRGFALFLAKQPGARLHVVGEGTQRTQLGQLTRRLGISEAVQFHGYLSQEKLSAVYDACDVFALQTLDEPFGMVFPEAAARGLLLVGPDHGGPLEILDGGRLGWTCDPFNAEATAEAFAQIWALSETEADARRTRADHACRSRYAETTIGPQLLRALAERPVTAAPSLRSAPAR
jgi:glycosyltransferase involved in cell wall biosynthesis